MNRRLVKQIIIGFIYLIIIGGIGTGIYFWTKPEPSCLDNKMNQDETGIDCGGTKCSSCELKTLSPISLSNVYSFTYDNKIDLAAKILNPNVNWGARYFKYKFILNGPLDKKLEVSGTDYILPLESKYIVRLNNIIDFTPTKIDFEIDKTKNAVIWEQPANGVLTAGATFLPVNINSEKRPKDEANNGGTYYNFTLTLKSGMINSQVRDLQVVLAKDPTVYPQAQVTGKFGAYTLAAVKKFQKKYNLSVTGIVDKATRSKLNELYGKPAQSASNNLESYEATYEVNASVFNNSAFNWKKIYGIIVLCDSQNLPIVFGQTSIENVMSNKSQTFTYRWTKPIDSKAKVCEQYAYTNVYDKNNYLPTY